MSNGYFKIEWEVSQTGKADVSLDNLLEKFPDGNPTDDQLINYLIEDMDENEQIKQDADPPRPRYNQSEKFIIAAREYMKSAIEDENNG